MKRIGPELKLSKLKGGELKMPPFLTDLYYDLRDRRLLPLVGLIMVAILAVPFLLAGGSEESEVPAPVVTAPGATSSSEPANLAVVEVNPGLRDYRKRLAGRKPTNPFRQRFTGPMLKGAQLQSQTSTTTSTTTTTDTASGGGTGGSAPEEPVTSSPEVPVAPGPAPPGGSTPGSGGEDRNGDGIPDGLTMYTFAVDLQITRIETKPNGKVERTEPKLREDVEPPAALPGEKAPVVTYLGMGGKTRAPLFLISTEVTGVFGEGKCVAGTGTCQLIALEPGFPVTFVYGENDVRYKINVLDVTPVPIEDP